MFFYEKWRLSYMRLYPLPSLREIHHSLHQTGSPSPSSLEQHLGFRPWISSVLHISSTCCLWPVRYKTFINMSAISKARSGEREEHGYQDHISGTCGRKALAVASEPPQKKNIVLPAKSSRALHTDHSAKQTEKWVAIIATGQYQFEQWRKWDLSKRR